MKIENTLDGSLRVTFTLPVKPGDILYSISDMKICEFTVVKVEIISQLFKNNSCKTGFKIHIHGGAGVQITKEIYTNDIGKYYFKTKEELIESIG